jgi:hypothetical protein
MPRRNSTTVKNGIVFRRPRDFKAEYARRKNEGLAKGLTLSQVRGHPKPGEAAVSSRILNASLDDRQKQSFLSDLRQNGNLRAAAKRTGISPERAKAMAIADNAIIKEGRRWKVNPALPRRMQIYSRGRARTIIVGDFATASLIGKYMNAVKIFGRTQNRSVLVPFEGVEVTDIKGKVYRLSTDPNVLYRLTTTTDETFEQVYRIVI